MDQLALVTWTASGSVVDEAVDQSLLPQLLPTQQLIQPLPVSIRKWYMRILLIIDHTFKATIVNTIDESLHIQHQVTFIARHW